MFVIGFGFSNGCDGVRVVRTAAVLADLLDRLLARDRAAGDRLRLAGDRRDGLRGVEVLDDALAHEHEREDERERQQDPRRRADEVDPEVAERVRAPAHEAADQRDRDRGAGGRRHEVVHREAGHLGEVRHRRLARRSSASSCS